METVETMEEKYIKFRDGEEKEYTRNFPRPSFGKKVFEKPLDPVIFAVIKARLDGIINEMVEVLLRTSRNPILYAAKDFTCSILGYDGKLLTMANSLPGHLLSMSGPLPAIIKAFEGDIHPGDCFVNNSVYYGNSHVGDWQMYVPVFYEGEIVSWSGTLCHLIDTGGFRPTNLDPEAKDVYEEAMQFPPLRIAKDYKEIPEIIRFIKANFRYPEQWHGDFLAQIGSLWKGEQGVIKLCEKYGGDVVKQFQDELIDYGDRRMTEEIRKLPKGVWSIEGLSERFEPICPEGLLFKVKMGIDPDEAIIIFDLTEMPDQLPWGHNRSWATSRIACLQGSMPAFDPSLPRNDGVYKHFHIILREGSVVGMPRWPVGTSCATTNLTTEVSNLVLNLWEQVEPGRGHGSSGEVNACLSVCSGTDFRHNNAPYGHMPFAAISGGGASRGCDGWPTMINMSVQGNMYLESVEVFELKIPNIIWELGIQTDGGGAGKWRGAPGFYHRIQPRHHTMTIVPYASGHTCAPQGIAGGKKGRLADHWTEKHTTGEKTQQFSNVGTSQIKEDEDWYVHTNGGGGYGDLLERDPEAVRYDARNYIISVKAARDEYGVVLNTEPELYEVDYEATAKLRAQLREERRK